MILTHEVLKRCDVIKIKGRVDSSKAPEVEAKFQEIIGEAKRYNIVVDMSELEFASSAFLRVLIAAMKTVRGKGGGIHLATASDRMKDVFQLAGITSLFKFYDTVTQAVGDF